MMIGDTTRWIERCGALPGRERRFLLYATLASCPNG